MLTSSICVLIVRLIVKVLPLADAMLKNKVLALLE